MKKVLISLILPCLFFASPFVDDENIGTVENANQNIETLDYSKDMKSVQKSLKNSSNLKMILNIKYTQNKTYKVHTRQVLSTHFIFENDKIIYWNTGDNVGFNITLLKNKKYDLSNILKIEPKIIGIDTNLLVIGASGNIYNFYIYSTDYKDNSQPKSIVFISQNTDTVRKINITDLEKEKFDEEVKAQDLIKQIEHDENNFYGRDFVTIGKGISKIKIKRTEIIKDFTQEGEHQEIRADEIFRDKKWTYFKYDSKDSLRKFPLIYRVVDGYDNPVNTRVVGDYIIVETVSDKFTLRLGNKYLCVRRTKKD